MRETRRPLRRLARVSASRLALLAAIGLAAALGSLEASAAEEDATAEAAPGAPPEDVEVIRIKGRAVTGIETDVPASVTQFDPKELEALGAQDVSDLAKVTPSVEIVTTSATTPTFFIRGVGLNDFSANASGAVAIYQDGVPLNAPALQLGQLFDTENVEILRGPQAYDDDRNASAGAIKTTSRRPDGSLGATLRSEYGNFGYKDFEGAVSAPIVEDVLASRLAFRWTERDPYYKNGCGDKQDSLAVPPPTQPPPQFQVCGEVNNAQTQVVIPPGLPTRVNDVGNWAARGQFRLQPRGTEMDWLLNAHGAKIDHFSPVGQVLGTLLGNITSTGYIDPAVKELFDSNRVAFFNSLPPSSQRGAQAIRLANALTLEQVTEDIELAEPFENQYDLVGDETQDSVGGFLRGDLPIGPIALTTITGAEHYDRSRLTDFDFSSNPSIHVGRDDRAWQLTQNLNLSGELADAPFGWRAGGFYLQEDLSSDSEFLLVTGPTLGAKQKIDQDYRQDLWSFGIYGNFRWDFLEDYTLEGGVRYNWERKNFEIGITRALGDSPPDTFPQVTLDPQTWSAPTGGLGLSYRFNEDVSIYAKYTRGWKVGQISASVLTINTSGGPRTTAEPTVAEPETIDAYEIGLKGSWLDGRLALGGSFYFYKYTAYQVFIIVNQIGSPPQLEVINANDARIYGAEVDLRAEPLDALVLSGRFGWIESQFLDFTDDRINSLPNDQGRLVPFVQTVNFTGNRLPNTPKFKASGAVEYTFELGPYGALIPRYDFSYTDDVFFDPSEGRGTLSVPLPQYAIGQRAYWIHNARLAYRTPDGNIEIAGWVRNVTDEIYKTYVGDISFSFDSLVNYVGDPRTYGGTISISF